MCAQFQNVANAITQQFFPLFLQNCGFYAFYMFAGINFLLAVFVFFIVPETKGIKLEEIDTIFGGQNHVEKGANLMGESRRPSVVAPGGRSDEIMPVGGTGYGHDNKTITSEIEDVSRKV